jgi:uncharacterized protein DUF4384
MILALVVSLLAGAPSGAAAAMPSDDPPIRVSLNHDGYFQRGDKARVNIELAEDGYVVVLRADADGRVRVLFPLDPGDDAFVRGGRKMEVRGRGDREAFFIDDREGAGLVLAARSATPLRFDEFVRGDHWDYRVLSVGEAGSGDREAALLEIVQRMAPDGHFDYDAVSYTATSQRAYYDDWYHPQYGWPSFGWPHRYGFYSSSCFDPFWYDPVFCGGYYDPFYYRPYRYRPFIFTGGVVIHSRPRYGGGLLIDRVRRPGGLTFKDRLAAAPTVMGVGPRLRVPQGTLLSRTTQTRERNVSAPAPDRGRGRDAFDGSQPARARERAVPAETRRPAAREPERAAPSRGRDSGVSRGGGGGGGGGRSSPSGASRPSGSSGSGRSAPSSGGGRRRP